MRRKSDYAHYFKVIVAGSREFKDYEFLKRKLDAKLRNRKNILIVSGTCRGADKLGEKYAEERGYHVERFPADWDGLGKKAGSVRNEEMAQFSDACVIFRLNFSPGSSDMKKRAKTHRLLLQVYDIAA